MSEIISTIGVIIVALIEGFAFKDRAGMKKASKAREEKEAERQEEMRLLLKMLSASIKLEKIIAKKVQNQQTNGDVEEANKSVEEAQEDYYNFINKIAAKHLNEQE